jgi:hypothetical protein
MRTAVTRGRVFFPALGEALQTDYNSVAKCRQKRRVPPTVSNLRRSAHCRAMAALSRRGNECFGYRTRGKITKALRCLPEVRRQETNVRKLCVV